MNIETTPASGLKAWLSGGWKEAELVATADELTALAEACEQARSYGCCRLALRRDEGSVPFYVQRRP